MQHDGQLPCQRHLSPPASPSLGNVHGPPLERAEPRQLRVGRVVQGRSSVGTDWDGEPFGQSRGGLAPERKGGMTLEIAEPSRLTRQHSERNRSNPSALWSRLLLTT